MSYLVGVDGEGWDAPDGRHLYTYLCAADAGGRVVADAYDARGLSLAACADVLLRIPRRATAVGFMFSYDATKIIEELPEIDRYRLMRPELRARRSRGGYSWRERVLAPDELGLDWFAGSLSVARGKPGAWRRATKVWDVFRFFQCSFVKALEQWQVGEEWERAEILAMKEQRGAFDQLSPGDVRDYCKWECALLALLMTRVIEAHERAGIKLRRLEGAGSTAGAILKARNVSAHREVESKLPPEVRRAAAIAYFGGRFENSQCKVIKRRVWGYDRSAAYPHALCGLPCLRHGKWRRLRGPFGSHELDAVIGAPMALVRLRMASVANDRRPWLPLPCRLDDGSIVYGSGIEGWYHREEALAALDGWGAESFHGPIPGSVEPLEAWIFEPRCSHDPWAWMPEYYRRRVEWGKEGAGLVLKFGTNACAGRVMQRVGEDPPYRSLLWAGALTARTRAAMLGAISAARDPGSILAIATDGLYSTERLELAPGNPHGTSDLRKPLGGWEETELPRGIVLVRPGLYFRRDAAVPDTLRARGIGRREAWEHREQITELVAQWDGDPEASVEVSSRRFHGARASVYALSECRTCERRYQGLGACPECGEVASYSHAELLEGPDGEPAYGRWIERRIEISLNPRPKRDVGARGRLLVRDLGGVRSLPYGGETTPEGQAMRDLQAFLLEQPDWD